MLEKATNANSTTRNPKAQVTEEFPVSEDVDACPFQLQTQWHAGTSTFPEVQSRASHPVTNEPISKAGDTSMTRNKQLSYLEGRRHRCMLAVIRSIKNLQAETIYRFVSIYIYIYIYRYKCILLSNLFWGNMEPSNAQL